LSESVSNDKLQIVSDFHQAGLISTLHQLGSVDLERLEKELLRHVKRRPIALVLPCLYSELQGDAVPIIVEQLKKVEYFLATSSALPNSLARRTPDAAVDSGAGRQRIVHR
jgi:hypothetical protein